MKPRNQLPLKIMNEHELRRLWAEFKTYMQTVEARIYQYTEYR